MPSWKAPVFVVGVSALPPFVYALWLRSTLNTTVTAVGCLLYLWFLSSYTIPFFRNPLRKIPSPSTAHFILGNAPEAMARPPAHNYARWAKTIPNDGLVYFSGFFHQNGGLVATSPEVVRQILSDKANDFIRPQKPINFLRRIIGNGLLIAEGSRHKLLRKLVNPAFHGREIQRLMPLFWKKGIHLCDVISAQLFLNDGGGMALREGVVEVLGPAKRTTLDVIGLAGVGRDFNTLDNNNDQIAEDFSALTDTSSSGNFYYAIANFILGQRLASIVLLKPHRRFEKITASLRASSTQLMEEKRERVNGNAEDHVDIISILMRNTSQLNDHDLSDELLTFLAAGSETTGSAITFLCYFLAKDPAVQQRLRDELKQHHLDRKNAVQPAEALHLLQTLPYLNAVCNESLRLFPPVPFTGRVTARPTTLCGYSIPAGVGIEISPYVINKLTSLWGEDAEEFVPERWLAEGSAHTGGADVFAFATFGHGARSCIGKEFARTEIKCIIAAIVLRFEFELEDKDYVPIPAGVFTVKPKDGLRLRLKER